MDIEAFPLVSATVMLVVGQVHDRTTLPPITGFHFRPFRVIDRKFLTILQPDVVLSALIARDFDAIDLARRLAEAGFTGRYRAVTASLPNRGAVVAEVRASVPNIDFDLFVMDDVRKR